MNEFSRRIAAAPTLDEAFGPYLEARSKLNRNSPDWRDCVLAMYRRDDNEMRKDDEKRGTVWAG